MKRDTVGRALADAVLALVAMATLTALLSATFDYAALLF